MTTADPLKRAAAQEALTRVRSGMHLGLGTGSTMVHFVDLLGAALAAGTLRDIVGVPTSQRTDAQARALGIPLGPLHQLMPLDLAVDGADEIDPRLDLIKGLGGALLREKMVAQAARMFVIVADESKRVERLATRSPLPVEVVPFGWQTHVAALEAMGARAVLRTTADELPYLTDNGNHILDCHFEAGIDHAFEVEQELRARAGVVDTGLFLGLATEAIVATASGLVVSTREDA